VSNLASIIATPRFSIAAVSCRCATSAERRNYKNGSSGAVFMPSAFYHDCRAWNDGKNSADRRGWLLRSTARQHLFSPSRSAAAAAAAAQRRRAAVLVWPAYRVRWDRNLDPAASKAFFRHTGMRGGPSTVRAHDLEAARMTTANPPFVARRFRGLHDFLAEVRVAAHAAATSRITA